MNNPARDNIRGVPGVGLTAATVASSTMGEAEQSSLLSVLTEYASRIPP